MGNAAMGPITYANRPALPKIKPQVEVRIKLKLVVRQWLVFVVVHDMLRWVVMVNVNVDKMAAPGGEHRILSLPDRRLNYYTMPTVSVACESDCIAGMQ
jgi:hypothetical protein